MLLFLNYRRKKRYDHQSLEEILEDRHPIIIMTGKNIIDYLKKEEEIYTTDGLVKWLTKRY